MTAEIVCGRCGLEQHGPDAAPLCETCGTKLRARLLGVRDVLGHLRDTAAKLSRVERDGGGSGDQERRTLDGRFPLTAAASPSPVDFGASEAAREIRRVVERWTLRLLTDTAPPCGHPTCVAHLGPLCPAAATRSRAREGLGDAAVWLADRWAEIRRRPWAPEAADELARVIGHGEALVDAPPETYFAGACDATLEDPDLPGYVYTCGWELRARLGDVVARCRGCGTEHDIAQRRATMLAGVAERRVSATDAARALSTPDRPVTASTVRGWKFRGHLEPVDVSDDGVPLYRLGDVLAVDQRLRYGTTKSTGKAS